MDQQGCLWRRRSAALRWKNRAPTSSCRNNPTPTSLPPFSPSSTWEMKNNQDLEATGSSKVRKQIVDVNLRWVTHLMSL
ncbi:hypothetical protein CIPAW_15G155800 [Carya illinoinensis]|uniref:Uncharacterized protein n=1 Tax=Carya illinoinensis TaxID=32201 RepID=A0A8T1N7W9_CARIL|nr:hypothetical protein CIPAW_15G155800 [Carya illinoinensis]